MLARGFPSEKLTQCLLNDVAQGVELEILRANIQQLEVYLMLKE